MAPHVLPPGPSHWGLSTLLCGTQKFRQEDPQAGDPRELCQLYVLAREHSGNALVSSHLTLLIAVPWKVCFSNVVLG